MYAYHYAVIPVITGPGKSYLYALRLVMIRYRFAKSLHSSWTQVLLECYVFWTEKQETVKKIQGQKTQEIPRNMFHCKKNVVTKYYFAE